MATTKIKLWQLQSAPDGGRLLITDLEGKLTYLLPDLDKSNPVLSVGDNGIPQWSENIALSKALEAINSIEGALTTANGYTDQKIAALTAGAPVALDTLTELAEKLGQEDQALAALIVQLDGKANKNEVYKKADVNLLIADRYQAATAYTDALKTAIIAGIKIKRSAMLLLPVANISQAELSLVDFQLTDGDPVPADAPLDVMQVFINGQLGIKSTDYTVQMPGGSLSDVSLKFPEISGSDLNGHVAVMVRWEEPAQIAA